jgi:uncharacterized protein YbjT (DUF2867 family)
MNQAHTVIVAGATGLTGQALVAALNQRRDIAHIIVLTRRSQPWEEAKVREVITDYHQPDVLSAALSQLGPIRAVFCALGTTKKKAGSLAAQRLVDHDAVVTLGGITRQLGATAFAFVSSIDASETTANAYLRMKGETEAALQQQQWPQLILARPSFLLGPRGEARWGEKIGIALFRLITPLLGGRWRKYRPIHVSMLAQAMIDHSLRDPAGTITLEGAQLGV